MLRFMLRNSVHWVDGSLALEWLKVWGPATQMRLSAWNMNRVMHKVMNTVWSAMMCFQCLKLSWEWWNKVQWGWNLWWGLQDNHERIRTQWYRYTLCASECTTGMAIGAGIDDNRSICTVGTAIGAGMDERRLISWSGCCWLCEPGEINVGLPIVQV